MEEAIEVPSKDKCEHEQGKPEQQAHAHCLPEERTRSGFVLLADQLREKAQDAALERHSTQDGAELNQLTDLAQDAPLFLPQRTHHDDAHGQRPCYLDCIGHGGPSSGACVACEIPAHDFDSFTLTAMESMRR